jgi:Holliday junction resolvasome RuvABC endonuclease subunit
VSRTTIMGIDPGAVSGAYAIYSSSGRVWVDDLAAVNGQLDGAALARVVGNAQVSVAVVEKVGAMPKQGVASTWKFGFACGIIQGVLMATGVPVHYVAPTVWKKHWGLTGKDKDASRALAIMRYPKLAGLSLKRHHGRADALLMLEWYREAVLRERRTALWHPSTQDPDEID